MTTARPKVCTTAPLECHRQEFRMSQRMSLIVAVSLGLLVSGARLAPSAANAEPSRRPAPIVVGGSGPSHPITNGRVPSALIPHPQPGLWEIVVTTTSLGQADVVHRGQICIGAPGDRVLSDSCPTGTLQRTRTGGYIVALSCVSAGQPLTVLLHSEGDYRTDWVEDNTMADGSRQDHVVRHRLGPCPAGATAFAF
jgi:hypothetical protein